MNLFELHEKFPEELDAVKHFEKIRWGKTIRCGYCDGTKIGTRQKDMRFFCKDCSKSFSVTTNTQLHNTRLPLQKWLMAFAIVTDAKKGLSAMQLERNIGVHYETAFNMYHKIREMMGEDNTSIEELEGIVEMDETFIGGKPRKFNDGTTVPDPTETVIPKMDKRIGELKKEGVIFKRGKGNPAKPDIKPKRGRGSNKIPVVGIVQREGNVVAQVMQDLTMKNLMDMVKKHVDEDEAVLVTDEYKGYARMNSIIEHIKIDHTQLYSYKGVNTNTIESFWAIIKRQIIGQHHHVTARHLPKYIAEAVFKYNNRNDDDMFATLVKSSMQEK